MSSSSSPDPILTLVLHPLTWLFLLMVWMWVWHRSRNTPYIHAKFDKKRHRPGDYVADGSKATSQMEMRVRSVIVAAGYRPLRQSTGLVIGGRDAAGARRKLTPDIILHTPRKVIVEVDPRFWHGDEGPHKIYEDMERNKQYAALGFAVVRVRIGWHGDPYARLSPNDMVTEQADFYPHKHATELYNRIRKAKVLHHKYWDRELEKLRPSHEMYKQSKGQSRGRGPQQGFGGFFGMQGW